MSHMDPYNLNQLIQSFFANQPYGPTEPPSQGLRAKAEGENAVQKALTNMPMKDLINESLLTQEMNRRAAELEEQRRQNQKRIDELRQTTGLYPNPLPETIPEGQVPQNENRPDVTKNVSRTPYVHMTYGTDVVPGLTGTTDVIRPFTLPLFAPQGPRDPNLPQGPHVRSPGRPEDEPPVSE